MSAPWQRLRDRVRNWALRRQGPDVLPLRLAPRRIYILPTGSGWAFALVIAAMFVAGMNYGNGLVLLLTFWLTGFTLVAMIQTQRSLAGAWIRSAAAQPVFAGDDILLELEIESGIQARDLLASGSGARPATPGHTGSGDTRLWLEFQAERRGRWQAPVLRLETQAPFGLFRAWTWLTLDVSTLVYPRPVGEARLPESDDPEGTRPRVSDSRDELSGLRPFREGDSPRQVAWKAYARGAPLLVREYQGAAGSSRILDYNSVPSGNMEGRLSQLCRWVVDTAADNLSWTLRLPGAADLSGSGSTHRRRCLEALAVFGPGANP